MNLSKLSERYHNGHVTDSLREFSQVVLGYHKSNDLSGLDQLLENAQCADVPMAFHYFLLLATSERRAELKNREGYASWFVKLSNQATIGE